MKFTIFTADCKGNAKNCTYPNRKEITSAEELLSAIGTDQVFAEYKNSRRAKANFVSSDVIAMDCDNTASDNPADWETIDSLSARFKEFDFCIFPSRNHMKVKNGKAARPKFHILFPCRRYTDEKEYAAMKKAVLALFPFFDSNAIDTAHFFYGSDCGLSDIVWHEAGSTIDALISVMNKPNVYREGERNNAMSRFAGRVLKRYGQCDRAFDLFLSEAEKCEPPLGNEELESIWKSAVRFYNEKIVTSPDYVPPDEYNSDEMHYKPSDYTDVGQARALAQEYGDELLFTTATDMLRYNGVYWEESKPKALKAVMEFTDLQLEEACHALDTAVMQPELTDYSREELITGGKRFQSKLSREQLECLARVETAQRYYAHVMKRRDVKYLLAALTAVKPLVECRVQDLDANAFLFNTPSYTIDLRMGVDGAREHDPNDRITKVTAFDPSDRGKDLWLSALHEFFGDDTELIDYVQQMMGLAAIGKVYVEALIIAYGDGGNGKSTFGNTIQKVFGTYSGVISADALTVGCKRNVKPELAEAKGKRFLIAAELEEGMRLNTSMVKQLCSTDEIGGEKKYEDPFSYTPTHTLLLYTNHLPKVGGFDDGIWRRLIVIPFNRKIPEKTDVKNYSEFLIQNAGEYVTKWLIEGAEKIIRAGFKITTPQAVKNAVAQYKEDNDWFNHFINDCCEVGGALSERSGRLYETYRAYCARVGEFTRNVREFALALERKGFMRRRRECGVIVYGLRIAEKDFTDSDD